MDYFLQQVLSGVATGLVYASLALALVLVYRGTGILNFAQGEIAGLSTFLAWSMLQVGLPWWAALPLIVVLSFGLGVALERVFLRPVERASHLNQVIVTLALLLGINAATGLIWGFQAKRIDTLFGDGTLRLGSAVVTAQQLGMAAVLVLVMVVLYAFFRYTPVGLRMRAAAANPDSARLLGIRVGWLLAVGWGMAAALGALAGILSAPIIGLDPNVMSGLLLFGFAAAALGGFNSMLGAVLGGLIVGVSQNLGSTYLPGIGQDLDLLVPFAIIVLVLLLRPTGLLGRASTVRV
jgi:branched-chain amino acid transport system permease protein